MKKMTFRLKTTNREPIESKIKKFGLLLFFIVVVFFGTYLQSLFSPLLTRVLSPFFSTGTIIKESIFSALPYLKTKQSLISENERLSKIAEDYNQLTLQYSSLKKELALINSSKIKDDLENAFFAYVIRAPDATPYDTFLLSSGARDGVKVGKRVYLLNSIPIGTISYVYDNTSLAKLYGSPGENFLAIIGDKDTRGTATGRGGGNFEIILPHGAEIKINDEIRIPEISEYPFSKVEDITETEGGTFIRILFKAPYKVLGTSVVAVEK